VRFFNEKTGRKPHAIFDSTSGITRHPGAEHPIPGPTAPVSSAGTPTRRALSMPVKVREKRRLADHRRRRNGQTDEICTRTRMNFEVAHDLLFNVTKKYTGFDAEKTKKRNGFRLFSVFSWLH